MRRAAIALRRITQQASLAVSPLSLVRGKNAAVSGKSRGNTDKDEGRVNHGDSFSSEGQQSSTHSLKEHLRDEEEGESDRIQESRSEDDMQWSDRKRKRIRRRRAARLMANKRQQPEYVENSTKEREPDISRSNTLHSPSSSKRGKTTPSRKEEQTEANHPLRLPLQNSDSGSPSNEIEQSGSVPEIGYGVERVAEALQEYDELKDILRRLRIRVEAKCKVMSVNDYFNCSLKNDKNGAKRLSIIKREDPTAGVTTKIAGGDGEEKNNYLVRKWRQLGRHIGTSVRPTAIQKMSLTNIIADDDWKILNRLLTKALSEGEDLPNSISPDGRRLTSVAISYGSLMCTSSLLTEGANMNLPDETELQATPLHHAIASGNRRLIRLLLSKPDADANAVDGDGFSLLMLACAKGYYDVACMLLDRNADTNAQDSIGWTAMHYAAMQDFREVFQLLLTVGKGNPFVQDDCGWTPKDISRYCLRKDMCQIIEYFEQDFGLTSKGEKIED